MNCGENASDYGSRWVRLNVGGTTFLTTRTTLARYPDSFLHRLCKGDSDLKTDKDESGAYLIERNPNYFAPILDFLRHGELIMDQQVAEEGVLREAEFFGLPDLARLVQLKIQDNLKARMVEQKLVEEWRMEEKLKLEQKLGIVEKKRTEKKPLDWMVRTFDPHRSMNAEMEIYIQEQLNDGWKLDRMTCLRPGGALVIM